MGESQPQTYRHVEGSTGPVVAPAKGFDAALSPLSDYRPIPAKAGAEGDLAGKAAVDHASGCVPEAARGRSVVAVEDGIAAAIGSVFDAHLAVRSPGDLVAQS